MTSASSTCATRWPTCRGFHPQPFGGKYRQIQVYVDPVKLEAHQLSLMDVVRTVNDANAILPAGDVRVGPRDYNIYTNSQLPTTEEINRLPLKSEGNAQVLVADVGQARDAAAIQTNIVRVDGQRSVYLPILKQGGNSNTIEVVNGIRRASPICWTSQSLWSPASSSTNRPSSKRPSAILDMKAASDWP